MNENKEHLERWCPNSGQEDQCTVLLNSAGHIGPQDRVWAPLDQNNIAFLYSTNGGQLLGFIYISIQANATTQDLK